MLLSLFESATLRVVLRSLKSVSLRVVVVFVVRMLLSLFESATLRVVLRSLESVSLRVVVVFVVAVRSTVVVLVRLYESVALNEPSLAGAVCA